MNGAQSASRLSAPKKSVAGATAVVMDSFPGKAPRRRQRRDLVGKDPDVGIVRAEGFGQDVGGRLDAMAASQGEEVGFHQVGEMERVIVELGDDQVAVCQQMPVAGAGDRRSGSRSVAGGRPAPRRARSGPGRRTGAPSRSGCGRPGSWPGTGGAPGSGPRCRSPSPGATRGPSAEADSAPRTARTTYCTARVWDANRAGSIPRGPSTGAMICWNRSKFSSAHHRG